MLRKALAALAATLILAPAALAANEAPAQPGLVVYVANLSKTVPQADIDAALPSFQTSVSRDLARYWGVDARLTTDPAAATSADMVVQVEDYADIPGALGYHDVIVGRPTSRVFAATGAAYNESWQLTFSHELDEMLVDPWINRFALWNKKQWLVEVCDPPESGQFAYFIGGIPMSDFITPRWYDSKLKGPYDFTRHIKRPGQVLNKGYASWKNPDGTWGQVFVGFSRFMIDA